MNSNLPLSQRIRNAAATQECENLLSRHVYYHARGASKEDFGRNWSEREDIVWGHGWGRCRSHRTSWFANVTGYDAIGYGFYKKIHAIWPQVGGRDPRALLGNAVHATNTEIIEVADDGMSLRATLYSPGMISQQLMPTKQPRALYHWVRYGIEAVYENGEWKFLQVHVCPDLCNMLDFVNWAHESYMEKVDPENAIVFVEEVVDDHVEYEVEDPGPIHNFYSPTQTVQNTCPWPEPYETLDDDHHFA